MTPQPDDTNRTLTIKVDHQDHASFLTFELPGLSHPVLVTMQFGSSNGPDYPFPNQLLGASFVLLGDEDTIAPSEVAIMNAFLDEHMDKLLTGVLDYRNANPAQ